LGSRSLFSLKPEKMQVKTSAEVLSTQGWMRWFLFWQDSKLSVLKKKEYIYLVWEMKNPEGSQSKMLLNPVILFANKQHTIK
jgi:hypothetical protein